MYDRHQISAFSSKSNRRIDLFIWCRNPHDGIERAKRDAVRFGHELSDYRSEYLPEIQSAEPVGYYCDLKLPRVPS